MMNQSVIWITICTILVFFMQAGFAMLETGFTRAKNAGNIIMKNLMDYCVGSILFWFIGYQILYGKNVSLSGDFPQMIFLMYATVFCATATTIVSGAMAGRTAFKGYLIYSAIMSAFIYPLSARGIWNETGWLNQLGFHDCAGGTAVHVVGGMTALAGAIVLGPRIGKFDQNGKARAIPGHNLTIGALGIFILWFGWFGFNGGSAVMGDASHSFEQMGTVLFNTNLCAAVCAVSTMFLTWIRYGKPDVSMTLNGVLAGLVAITAGCDVVEPVGALITGIVVAFVLIFGVELVTKLKVDDPVGAVAVHGLCGAVGSVLIGVFSVETGVLYTGKWDGLGIQLLGVLATGAGVFVVMFILFHLVKNTVGLRVSQDTEITGLDKCEHGLASSYADFFNTAQFLSAEAVTKSKIRAIDETTELNISDYEVDGKLRNVVVMCNASKFEILKTALDKLEITGMTVTQVCGCGIQKGNTELYRGAEFSSHLLPKIKVEIVISTVPLGLLIDTLKNVLYTGNVGDGKIFVYELENVVKIRTGAEGKEALE